MYDITVESARIINEEGVKSVAVVGLHPAEGYELLRRGGWSREEVLNFMRRGGIDLAAEYVKEAGRWVLVRLVGLIGRCRATLLTSLMNCWSIPLVLPGMLMPLCTCTWRGMELTLHYP